MAIPAPGPEPRDNASERRQPRRTLAPLACALCVVMSMGCGSLDRRVSVDPTVEATRDEDAPERKEVVRRTRPGDPAVVRAQAEDMPRLSPAARGILGLPPISELLDDSPPNNESIEFPSTNPPPRGPDIRDPGPDTANFPNSAYTLPQGRFYVEASPAFISGPSLGSPATYNAEFLLRYGLTDRVELRLFSNGPAAEKGIGAFNGMSPLAWDLKMNFWKENRKYWIPAVGLEVFVLTPTGSPGLNQGTQPSINLLFDHTLPYGFQLEYNVGLVGDPSPNNTFSAIEPVVTWALQRELFEDFDVFFQGYFNGPTLPRFGDGIELGGGAVYALNSRLAIFGSYNAGVTSDAPTTIFQIGGAMSF